MEKAWAKPKQLLRTAKARTLSSYSKPSHNPCQPSAHKTLKLGSGHRSVLYSKEEYVLV
jgi:hypothetical protein